MMKAQASVRYDRANSNAHDFESKLSVVYNSLATLDNGTVLQSVFSLQINVSACPASGGSAQRAFRVALQGMVLVDPAHRRITASVPDRTHE